MPITKVGIDLVKAQGGGYIEDTTRMPTEKIFNFVSDSIVNRPNGEIRTSTPPIRKKVCDENGELVKQCSAYEMGLGKYAGIVNMLRSGWNAIRGAGQAVANNPAASAVANAATAPAKAPGWGVGKYLAVGGGGLSLGVGLASAPDAVDPQMAMYGAQ